MQYHSEAQTITEAALSLLTYVAKLTALKLKQAEAK
jgi:hypothetical protein